MAHDRRPRDDDEDEDDRPQRKRRPVEDDEEPPRRKARVREDDDEDEERPRRRRKKKPAGMSKGLLFGLIGGGVALVGLVVLLIVLLGGGGSPKTVVERSMKAIKNGDFGTMYDNMSSSIQKPLVETMRIAAESDPAMRQHQSLGDRELFVTMCKEREARSGNPFKAQGDATILGETITGNTATVRLRNPNGREETIPLVKENGRWKIAGL